MLSRYLLAFFLIAATSFYLHARDVGLEDRDEFEFQERLDPEAAVIKGDKQGLFEEGRLLWDFGAIGRASFINFQSTNRRYIGLWSDQLRYWAKARIAENFDFYIRMKTSRIDYRSGDTITGDHHNRDDSKLDLGYFGLGDTNKGNYRLILGRYYAIAGQGLVLAKVLDGARLEGKWSRLRYNVYGGRSIQSDNHPNPAFPSRGDSNFRIGGLQASYYGWSRHSTYMGMMWSKDYTDKVVRTNQYFEQDLNMGYAGLRGQLVTDLRYSVEYIHEEGRISQFGGVKMKEKVQSRAILGNLQFILPNEYGVLQYDYKRGSGDNDRQSVTEIGTSRGSNVGGTDTNFFYLGYTDTGLSYAPRLSNIQIHHLSWTFRKKQEEADQSHQITLDLYNYTKVKKNAETSDTTTDFKRKTKLGFEADLTYQYRPFGNVSLVSRGGWFFPGPAYAQHSPRPYYRFDLYVDF